MKFIYTFLFFVFISCTSNGTESESKVTGSELIGGSYTMLNHHGEKVTEKTYMGQYQLIFFGFTTCKTVCPLGLNTMKRFLKKLDPSVEKKIQPVFVTIDPDKDTNSVLKEYLSRFHKRFIGYRGTEKQIDHMIKVFRGYYGRIEEEGGDYSFDHSDMIYFIGKKGEYITHFSSAMKKSTIVQKINKVIKSN